MRFIILVSSIALLALGAWAQEDDDMFLEDSSGEVGLLGPADDEDGDKEGSGATTVTYPNDDENFEVVTETTEKTKEESPKISRNIGIENELDQSPDVPLEPIDKDPVKEKDLSKEPNDEVDIDPEASVGSATTPLLAAVIVGGCIGLLFAVCVIMLLVYRMRKKDEGSYALDYGLDKKPQGNYEYTKGVDSKEYFA